MLFNDLNLEGIESELFNNFSDFKSDDNIVISLDMSDDCWRDFNDRIINPDNINSFIDT